MIGMLPTPGKDLSESLKSSWINPAIAKLWPLRSSTVVVARRTFRPGTLMSLVVTAVLGSIALTSDLRTRSIVSDAITVGVKDRPTPKSLYSIVVTGTDPVEDWTTGMGNSPPARSEERRVGKECRCRWWA